jgi:hypothetical protein
MELNNQSRITFDGSTKRRIASIMVRKPVTLGGAWIEYSDLIVKNLKGGIAAGGSAGANDADSVVRRVLFKNISQTAFSTRHGNSMNWTVSDSVFEDCDVGLGGAIAGWFVRNSIFLRSKTATKS